MKQVTYSQIVYAHSDHGAQWPRVNTGDGWVNVERSFEDLDGAIFEIEEQLKADGWETEFKDEFVPIFNRNGYTRWTISAVKP